jgi:hypothetical protein
MVNFVKMNFPGVLPPFFKASQNLNKTKPGAAMLILFGSNANSFAKPARDATALIAHLF